MGRPGVVPGAYFRMQLVGYFEGLDSERGIAWRCADSLSLREFLGVGLAATVPDYSTVSRTRRLIDVETHGEVFTWMLLVLAGAGLIDGKTVGVDASTLEANAAMRSIVRRDNGEAYNDFLTRLAKESGIETPTRADLAKPFRCDTLLADRDQAADLNGAWAGTSSPVIRRRAPPIPSAGDTRPGSVPWCRGRGAVSSLRSSVHISPFTCSTA